MPPSLELGHRVVAIFRLPYPANHHLNFSGISGTGEWSTFRREAPHHILLMLGGMPYRDLVHRGIEVSGISWGGGLPKKLKTDPCAIFSMAAEEIRTVMEVVDEKQAERQGSWKKEKVEEREVQEKMMEWCPWGEG